MTKQDFINRLLLYVSELSDRTSPEDQPEMMLVTGAELENGVNLALEQCDLHLTTTEPVKTYRRGLNGCWVLFSEGGYNATRIIDYADSEDEAKAKIAAPSTSPIT